MNFNEYMSKKLNVYLGLCNEGELEYSDITLRNLKKIWKREYELGWVVNG